VFLVATAGKLGGVAVAARVTGSPWREALGIGVLMNTRGLMELVILNVGLEIGVISPTFFTMMVLMALATTAITSPVLAMVLHRNAPAPAPRHGGAGDMARKVGRR
jgi:Kef-type K+ transport system membrane component KefB